MDPSRGCAWVARDARKTYLVNEVLAMIVAELLRPNDAMEVGLHELLNEVDLLEVVETRRTEDIENGDDVLVMKVAEELDFAEGAEAEEGVLEGEDLLDRDLSVGGLVEGGDDGAVCAFAEAMENLVVLACGRG